MQNVGGTQAPHCDGTAGSPGPSTRLRSVGGRISRSSSRLARSQRPPRRPERPGRPSPRLAPPARRESPRQRGRAILEATGPRSLGNQEVVRPTARRLNRWVAIHPQGRPSLRKLASAGWGQSESLEGSRLRGQRARRGRRLADSGRERGESRRVMDRQAGGCTERLSIERIGDCTHTRRRHSWISAPFSLSSPAHKPARANTDA